jgi:hypothetical protein
MRNFLNRFMVITIVFLTLINFYLAPKSTVAYNTKNLTTMNIMAKNNMKKDANIN